MLFFSYSSSRYGIIFDEYLFVAVYYNNGQAAAGDQSYG